jgi:AcrR family transcriptional regulator
MSTVKQSDRIAQRPPLRAGRSDNGATIAGPRTARGIETRERLVKAGLAEFALHGYVAARVESITERAGVGYGTFYRYFKNKAALIAQVADEVYSDIFAQATSQSSSSRPVRERIFNDYLGTLRAYTFHRDALRVLDAAVGVDPAVAREVARLQERDVERYASIISTTAGYHPVADPHRVSLLVNSLGDEVARRWIHSKRCSGDPRVDEPELQRLARLFTLMCTVALEPASVGVSEAAIDDLMDGMVADDYD